MFNKQCRFFQSLLFLAVAINVGHADTPKKLVETMHFAVPGQNQIMKFIATKKAVYASVHLDKGSGWKRILAAWDTKGKLIWKIQTERAYQLVKSDKDIIIAFDKDNYYDEKNNGLIWIDAASGKENHRLYFKGRPSSLVYYPKEKVSIVRIFSMGGYSSWDTQLPEIHAYNSQGKLVWARKGNNQLLKADGNILVIKDDGNRKLESVQRLNPLTGATLWKKQWVTPQKFESVQIEKRDPKPNLDKLS